MIPDDRQRMDWDVGGQWRPTIEIAPDRVTVTVVVGLTTGSDSANRDEGKGSRHYLRVTLNVT